MLMKLLGRGGSDLTATTIGKALGLREIQVGADMDVKNVFIYLFFFSTILSFLASLGDGVGRY